MIRRALVLLGLVGFPYAGPVGAETPRPPVILNACAGDLSNVPYWTEALKAPDPQRRVQAARNLGETRSAGAVAPLVEALKDENVEVRLAAIQALGRIGRNAKAAVPALTAMLRDQDSTIRSGAARALAKIGEPR